MVAPDACKNLFNPWEAPQSALRDAGVELGIHYPRPVVDLKESRESALKSLGTLKSKPRTELKSI